MNQSKDGDTTRSLSPRDAALWDSDAVAEAQQCLCMILAFHPDTSRIGEIVWMESAHEPMVLGRQAPLFTPLESAESRGLGDGFISREAFSLACTASQWHISRKQGKSRLRVNGREVRDHLMMSDEQLQQGVVITLGERIVLHLRLRSPMVLSHVPPELASLRGISPAMQRLRESAQAAANSEEDVLLVGPTGTGKERIARAIHALSKRSQEPWVAVNMGAMPVDLATANFFGSARGAYTGADRNRKGFFQEADGGTLFLDEIGDTPVALQAMLLRALQEREVQVVGGKSVRVDLRVIAAMEQDPDQMRESFRPALRYRLGAHEVYLPSLNERSEDVALLAAELFAEKAREAGCSWDVHCGDAGVSPWARLFEQFLLYEWPGNIRELQHTVSQISGISAQGLQLPKAVRERLSQGAPNVFASKLERSQPETEVKESVPQRLSDVPDDLFLKAWKEAHYEVAAVAKSLGVSRPAIYRRLHTLRECRLAADVPLGELLSTLDACRGDLRSTAERLAVSRRGLQARLRASGVGSAQSPHVLEGQDPG